MEWLENIYERLCLRDVLGKKNFSTWVYKKVIKYVFTNVNINNNYLKMQLNDKNVPKKKIFFYFEIIIETRLILIFILMLT